jgi:hypothetical protein
MHVTVKFELISQQYADNPETQKLLDPSAVMI